MVFPTYTAVTRFTRFMIEWTKTIGNNLGIDCNLTSIVSRLSFSTRLKRSDVSTEFIQESLGHPDKSTTIIMRNCRRSRNSKKRFQIDIPK